MRWLKKLNEPLTDPPGDMTRLDLILLVTGLFVYVAVLSLALALSR